MATCFEAVFAGFGCLTGWLVRGLADRQAGSRPGTASVEEDQCLPREAAARQDDSPGRPANSRARAACGELACQTAGLHGAQDADATATAQLRTPIGRPREGEGVEEHIAQATTRFKNRQVTGGTPISPLGRAKGSGTAHRGRKGARKVFGLGGYSQSSRVMLCMVGMPARGKSYITKMLSRYLQWSGFPVKIFNAGNLRRQDGMASASASFFQSENKEAGRLREKLASECMEEAILWLSMQTSVCVAIFDATNTTKRRRQVIVERCRESRGITPVFVESICDSPAVLEVNYRLKMGNEDYAHMDQDAAMADFMERVKAYAVRYEGIDDDEQGGELTFIKLFNVGQKVVMHRCSGYLVSQIGFYLSNIHIQPRCIWLTRHAEAEDEVHRGEITSRGKRYCSELGAFLQRRCQEMQEAPQGEGAEMLVLMGTAPVHSATFECMSFARSSTPVDEAQSLTPVHHLTPQRSVSCSSMDSLKTQEVPAMSTSLLNELDRGNYASVTYDRIHKDYPEVWAQRQQDPLHFRYPGAGAESYADVVGRLRPIIIELERQRRSVLVISHLAVQRCLYAYFTACPMEDLPNLQMDMHCVVELQPGPFGCEARRFCFDADGFAGPRPA